jgi:protein phosphatase
VLVPKPGSFLAALPSEVTLPGGEVLDCSGFQGRWPTNAWEGRPVRVGDRPFVLYALHRGWWRDLGDLVRQRARLANPLLPVVQVFEVVGGNALVLASRMPGGQAVVSDSSISSDEHLEILTEECRLLAQALEGLHAGGLAWLEFNPGCLETADSRLQITNLDLQVFRQGVLPENLVPSRLYSPPEILFYQAEQIGPATDVFQLAAHLYYRLAGLHPQGFPGDGLPAFDFAFPPLRIYCPWLPAGISPLLERALARETTARFATPGELAAAFDDACRAARSRWAGPPVQVEVGGLTATGKAKAVRGLVNQDLLSLVSRGEGHLAVVADGVSLARVGSGELASQIAGEVLTAALADVLEQSAAEQVEQSLVRGCLQASQAILDRALTLGPLPDDFDPADLMGSTVLIGVVRGNRLTLANLGDSRAYLLTPQPGGWSVEQLTVDGDMRSEELRAGMPPEEARALGSDGSALYCCLGVGEFDPDGNLVSAAERATPSLSHWPIWPGLLIVLCTDGLVEEHVFLSPADLTRLAAEHPDLSAQALAELLVAEADARQLLPDEQYPEGMGDNITCVVLRVREGPGESGHAGSEDKPAP